MRAELERALEENRNLKAREITSIVTVTRAIHNIEGDNTFTTDDLLVAIGYLTALMDPQD
jgi:hypothetical protein